jgi:FlaA1/EpsC-like NDP-sugar epimerase
MKLIDLIMMISAFSSAAWIAHYNIESVPFEELVTMRIKVLNFILFISIGWVWYWVFSSFGLYDSDRFAKFRDELLQIVKATTAGTIVILIDSYLFEIELITPTFIWLFWAISILLSILSRLAIKTCFRKLAEKADRSDQNIIYSKESFKKLLEKERIRADRYNSSYSLLLFSIKTPKHDDSDISKLIELLSKRIRIIDEIGWYDAGQIGVLLPYTSNAGACKLSEQICSSMTEINCESLCTVFTYPMTKSPAIKSNSFEQAV